MVDRLTPDQRRLNMSRVRAKDTRPEMTVRGLLHHAGFRYRLHRRDLPGRPDIVLPRYRAAIFVHGCFWHGHDCSLFRMPATRPEFWAAKIAANRRRDWDAVSGLRDAHWRSLLIWECALRGRGRLPAETLTDRITAFIASDVAFAAIREMGAEET
ncbi:DNA mismatch repair protein [Sphingomonas sp. Root50]|nr:DNA mismatch repair protein [Sphingomonas sp. Root1294]KQY65867.1 DNA mismatch repair protein [Sphingomonas sp. Root50]KRB95309.1 DNA mismatch repair protein [Sphingomonas sp. Root720]